ncbi:hypothetical protein GDO86_006103, partial [Hymenochirus boettgeri]
MSENQEQPSKLFSLNVFEKLNRQPTPQLCRFFSQGRHCRFGDRCRFLHQPLAKSLKQNFPCKTAVQNSTTDIPTSSNTDTTSSGLNKKIFAPQQGKYRPPKLCRYYASGYCSKESHCKFWHPEVLPPINDINFQSKKAAISNTEGRTPVQRPQVLPEGLKYGDVTVEMATQLRGTEISQLLKRFPKDKVIVQEREDGKVTYYRVSVEPTDPDWPFDLKEMEIMVEFPADYPLQVFTVKVPEDQDLLSIMGRYVTEASMAWLEAKHATNQLIGKLELLFRPYLHWLDRNMERLFTEGARLLKRDIEAEKAGIEFVPYQQLQASVSALSCEDVNNKEQVKDMEDPDDDYLEDDSDSWTSCDDEESEPICSAGPNKSVINVKGEGVEAPKKGTEISFLGLKLGEDVGTLIAHNISVCLQCNRCKMSADLSLSGKQPCTAQCDRCNSRISVSFSARLVHQFSVVLGYLDIQGAIPKDLILQDCIFIISCLSCSQEGQVQNLSYGISKNFNCLHCHCKLSVKAEASKFQKVERYPGKTTGMYL